MTGASSREEEYWTKSPSPAKTVTDPHTDEDTIVILAVGDRASILEVVERRWEGMRRCRI
jgi:hypothetical protein